MSNIFFPCLIYKPSDEKFMLAHDTGNLPTNVDIRIIRTDCAEATQMLEMVELAFKMGGGEE